MIETSEALHLLIHHQPHPLTLPSFPNTHIRSLHLFSNLTTSILSTILPASLNSQLSANECKLGEGSFLLYHPLPLYSLRLSRRYRSSNNPSHTGTRMNGSLKVHGCHAVPRGACRLATRSCRCQSDLMRLGRRGIRQRGPVQ